MLSDNQISTTISSRDYDIRVLLDLLKNSPLITETLADSQLDVDLSRRKMRLLPHAENGTNRRVLKLIIGEGDQLIQLALKVARNTGQTAEDHAVMSQIVNTKLGIPSGTLFRLSDQRLVSAGRFLLGVNGNTSFANSPQLTMKALMIESLSIWDKLGGFFIPEPKGDQFLISGSSLELKATLIDKGDFKKKIDRPYNLAVCPTTARVSIQPTLNNLNDLGTWLEPMSVHEVISRVIVQQNVDDQQRILGDPDNEMLALVRPVDIAYRVEPEAVVAAAVTVFGTDKAKIILEQYMIMLQDGKERLVEGPQDAIVRQFREVISKITK
jgi:hypothetical protein